MALIKCRECGKEYSDQAAACPACACPTTPGRAGATPIVAKAPVQTELTAKTWKGLQVLCMLAAVSGCVIGVATMGSAGEPLAPDSRSGACS